MLIFYMMAAIWCKLKVLEIENQIAVRCLASNPAITGVAEEEVLEAEVDR